MSLHTIFTYGTLQRGERNYERYMHGARFVREARTKEPSFVMVQFESVTSPGKFSPGVLKVDEGSHIIGQLFEVDAETMAGLDVLEGVGVKYDRELVPLDDGTKAWMYLRRGENKPVDSPHIHYDPAGNSYQWKEKALTP